MTGTVRKSKEHKRETKKEGGRARKGKGTTQEGTKMKKEIRVKENGVGVKRNRKD